MAKAWARSTSRCSRPKGGDNYPRCWQGGFVERGENLLAFGLPGHGKTHLVAALGRELILRHGLTVLFTPTFKLVQQLLNAKQALKLEAALKQLDGMRS